MSEWIYGFFMAWGMFLAIPCPKKIWSESARRRMLACLPLVGLIAGGVWALCAWLGGFLPRPIGALLCAAAQTTPGFLAIGAAKPVFLLPLCLAVAVREGEYPGACFGAGVGLLWDFTSGRVVGLLALSLLVLCFASAVLIRLYLRISRLNFALVVSLCAVLVLSEDFLFYDLMRGYSGLAARYLTATLPTAVFTGVVSPLILLAVDAIRSRTTPEQGL